MPVPGSGKAREPSGKPRIVGLSVHQGSGTMGPRAGGSPKRKPGSEK